MAKYVTLHDTDDEIIYPQISTDSIANGTISSDKIDWTSFGCIETSFYFEDQADQSYVDVVTNKGTQLRIYFIASGTPMIASGASSIKMIDVKVGSYFSSNTRGYDLCGISSGATVYTRAFRQFANGGNSSTEAVTNQSWNLTLDGTTYYGAGFGAMSGGAKISFFTDYTVVKIGAHTSMMGKAGSGGSLSSISFETQISSVPSGVFPALLQASGEIGLEHNVSYLKVYESAV